MGTPMTESLAIKYSLAAYKAALATGSDSPVATRAAMAKFRSFYPNAVDGDIRAKLAKALAEERVLQHEVEPSSA